MNLERIGDFSKNMYATAMGKLALDLIGLSWLLVIPFLLYWITAYDSAPGMSPEAVVLLLGGDFVFSLVILVASLGFVGFLTILPTPLGKNFSLEMTHNIQSILWVAFGLALCVASGSLK